MANAQGKPLTHVAIFRRYFLIIAATFILLAAENILNVLTPFLLGRAIDGLIAQSRTDLFIFLGVAMASLIISVARRVFDTRAYGRIYRKTAGEVVAAENTRDAPITKISARTGFVSEFTEFFEYTLPMIMVGAASLGGAVIMLYVISPMVSAGALLVALLTTAIFYFSRKRIESINTGLNDEMERKVDILTTRDEIKIGGYFTSIVRWRVRLSDLEARNFGGVFALTILLSAYAVYMLVAVEGKSEGQIFAALAYILQLTEALIMLPYGYQEFIRTKEISNRIGE